MGLGDLKKPGGPPPRPPPSGGAPMMKLKPPPMAPPPRDLAANTAQRPAVSNIKGIDPTKSAVVFGGSPDDKAQPGAAPGAGPGRGPPPGRGFTPSFQPTEFAPDSKSGIIEQGKKGAAPPKFQLKPSKKEGAISMFEADPSEQLPLADSKAKPTRPPPPKGPPSGIPEGKPPPPKTLPPSVKAAPRPMRPPPGKGRAPPPMEEEDTGGVNAKKHPPESEPPFKRGYKKPKVEEVVIIKRRDKDDPEFEESSSDEEEPKKAVPVAGPSPPLGEAAAAPMEEADQAAGLPAGAPAPTMEGVAAKNVPVTEPPKPAAPPGKPPPGAPPIAATVTPEKIPSRPVSAAEDPVVTPSRPPTGPKDKPPSRPPSAAEPAAGRPMSAVSSVSTGPPPSIMSAIDEGMSEVSGSVASQLITAPPPGMVVHKDPNAPIAQREGIGEFVPPIPLNLEGIESQLSKDIKGGRLNVTCLQGIGLKKKEDKSKNPRVDPYIRFKLGAADKWPWKQTTVRRKQETNADFGEELVSFDVVKPSQFIYQEDIQLCIEVWNKGTFKDEVIGTVTMSVVRFFKNPFKAYTEKVPIVAPGDRTSTSKVTNYAYIVVSLGIITGCMCLHTDCSRVLV